MSSILSRKPQPSPPPIEGIAEGTLPRFDYSDERQRAEASKLQLHEARRERGQRNRREVEMGHKRSCFADTLIPTRRQQVPFMIYNVPNINHVKELWSDDAYLKRRFGSTLRSVTISDSNHFMVCCKRAGARWALGSWSCGSGQKTRWRLLLGHAPALCSNVPPRPPFPSAPHTRHETLPVCMLPHEPSTSPPPPCCPRASTARGPHESSARSSLR